MSTFDGYVNEFPDIRIDFFRSHGDKSPPQACFLSHVHSDHLHGLETLKMPFVYCSSATRKILLKLEKYPHRINFAKGILEARKLTYRSLKLVLRALPLETPVDIELSPKTKIRVTLFDANHCPGAVMFLIEGNDKAILYTGDIRAEPWWVNSISRSPLLLPYSCGAKRLDCIYLDTTFASRRDIYETFPTKADGLKELLMKVSKCPKSSLVYFRSWTFGYEDVWIALSNFLRSSVHVDRYQLRIFRSLADDVNNTDQGPALAGFNYGNQHQPGCLTDDANALIHSCEPGTDCYENIKKQQGVVWITPIVSRLKDGTEVKEVGAGGGSGDLYQTPELELVDDSSLETLETLCAGDPKYKQTLRRLRQALSVARAKGDPSIALEGIDLDQEQEITLKQFVQLMSARDESETNSTGPNYQNIHFPFSRHSSFSELRHLISCFRPKDVCPCTVDIESWSEKVSMQALFGDLCSESVFRHDSKIREKTSRQRETNLGQKRKRKDETEMVTNTKTQNSMETEQPYVSAETSICKTDLQGTTVQVHNTQVTGDEVNTQVPTPIRRLHRAVSDRFDGRSSTTTTTTRTSAAVSITQPAASRTYTLAPGGLDVTTSSLATFYPKFPQLRDEHSGDGESDSDISAPLHAFASGPSVPVPLSSSSPQKSTQPKVRPARHSIHESSTSSSSHCNDDIDHDDSCRFHSAKEAGQADRTVSRVRAYRAAKAALSDNDPSRWQDLRLRSLGWKGHTEEEILL